MNTASPRRFDDDAATRPGSAGPVSPAGPVVIASAIVLSTLLLACALAVVLGSAAAGDRLRHLTSSTEVLVVMKPGATTEQVEALKSHLAETSGVAEARLVLPPLDAGAANGTDPGLKQVPSILRVRASEGVTGLRDWVTRVGRAVGETSSVGEVRVDDGWVGRVDGWATAWAPVHLWIQIGVHVGLAVGTAALWWLTARAYGVQRPGAGAHLLVIVLGTSILICAALAGSVMLLDPGLDASALLRSSQATIATLLCLTGAVAIASNAFARR